MSDGYTKAEIRDAKAVATAIYKDHIEELEEIASICCGIPLDRLREIAELLGKELK